MKWGAHKVDGRLAAKNAVKIRAALRQSVDAEAIYNQYLETHPVASKNRTLDRTKARSWAILNVRFNNEATLKILERVWAEGYLLGVDSALDAVKRAEELKKSAFTDWSNWKPGNRVTALLVRPIGSLKKILDNAHITIKGLDTTGYDRIGTALADSFDLGLSPSKAAKLILDEISDPARALTIAITEGSRAMNMASMDTYQNIGLEEVEWFAADPCPECEVNDGQVVPVGQEFFSGDTEPPVHPNCRCALLPVIPDSLTSDTEFNDLMPSLSGFEE